jgi:hypothetical protein
MKTYLLLNANKKSLIFF